MPAGVVLQFAIDVVILEAKVLAVGERESLVDQYGAHVGIGKIRDCDDPTEAVPLLSHSQ